MYKAQITPKPLLQVRCVSFMCDCKVNPVWSYIYCGPSVSGNRCDPRTLPHCPMIMYNGIPAAFFVSEPRLCVTRNEVRENVSQGHITRQKILTPCEGNPDTNVGTNSNTERGEVSDVDIVANGKKKSNR